MRQIGPVAAMVVLALGLAACAKSAAPVANGGGDAQGSTQVQRPAAAPATTP